MCVGNMAGEDEDLHVIINYTLSANTLCMTHNRSSYWCCRGKAALKTVMSDPEAEVVVTTAA